MPRLILLYPQKPSTGQRGRKNKAIRMLSRLGLDFDLSEPDGSLQVKQSTTLISTYLSICLTFDLLTGCSYYEYLSPLTPISPPTFRDPGTHPTLLIEEPILTVTLLTIATRYRQIPGPGGHCRSHAIHEQLWTYLRGMIERCLWGQEAFGGGFCGSGAESEAQTSSTAPWRGLRKGSLRTLGTIESLMILTEWHPRALHFPPAEATDELMLPSYDVSDTYSTDEEFIGRLPRGVGGKRIESWLEPAWRSDRMCWMLLSTAMGLSYELGVFDEIEELLAAGGEMTRPEYEDEAYRLRAARIKRLLLIYVTQLAGRLGWTNMVPENLRVTDPAFAPRKRRPSIDGKTPETNTTVTNSFNYIPDLELDDQIIHCWAGISNAMRIGNEKLFRSRQYTTKIINDSSYVELLKDFQPMLKAWKTEFTRFNLPQYIGHILSIEYQYVRIYVNSLSLQAVVERCSTEAGNRFNATGHPGNGSVPGAMSTENQQTYYGKLPLATFGSYTAADQDYVKEVVDGSRELLKIVVDGLLPGDYLKHAPVRTYFRIISGAMFLLKTFALGASKGDVEYSIGLMDRAVDALRTCVVDDVHLGIRFADLLETLTSRLRGRFISAPGPNPNGDPISRARSPAMHHEPDNKRQKMDQRDQIREWNAATPNYGMGNGAGKSHKPYYPSSYETMLTSQQISTYQPHRLTSTKDRSRPLPAHLTTRVLAQATATICKTPSAIGILMVARISGIYPLARRSINTWVIRVSHKRRRVSMLAVWTCWISWRWMGRTLLARDFKLELRRVSGGIPLVIANNA